ncbi:class I SAM-dependent methyltransferase [Paenibacillus sp. 2RAB27]|uniref:class I SAM-dependent methyltransferase n=1 Tax=Paenibacillus sp. 2RAB27 TaxID=3232991 RepID=UPI003F96B294
MKDWYKDSFGQDYLMVYKHRDHQGAYNEVKEMVEWLQLPKEATILDLCCGMGRHSMALTEFGYLVTGVDLSQVLLSEAKNNDRDGKVEWLLSDMRAVPREQSFDAIVNLFTSFGYFESDNENQKVLHEVYRLLKPGGQYIIDYLNPGYVTTHLVAASEREEEGLVIKEERSIEGGYVRKRIKISQTGASDRNYIEQIKLYDKLMMLEMMNRANLVVDKVYGSYEGQVNDDNLSPRMIFIGHKE